MELLFLLPVDMQCDWLCPGYTYAKPPMPATCVAGPQMRWRHTCSKPGECLNVMPPLAVPGKGCGATKTMDYGKSCMWHCEPGYKLDPPGYTECGDVPHPDAPENPEHFWVDIKTQPRCVRVAGDVPDPFQWCYNPAPVGASLENSGCNEYLQAGEPCEWACQDGFTLEGQETRCEYDQESGYYRLTATQQCYFDGSVEDVCSFEGEEWFL